MRTLLLLSAAFILSLTSISAESKPRPRPLKPSIKQRFQKRYGGHLAKLRHRLTAKGVRLTLNKMYRTKLKARDIKVTLRKITPYYTDAQFREGNNFNRLTKNSPYPAQSLIHRFGFSLTKSGAKKVGRKLSGYGKVSSPESPVAYQSHVKIKGDITVVAPSYTKQGKKVRQKTHVTPIKTYLGYDFL